MDEPSDRLRRARERAGLATAEDAAQRFGWNVVTYRSHENGTRGLRPAVAERYARAFRVEASWLLYGTGDSRRRNEVPIMGFIGAGAEIEPEFEQVPPDGLRQVELPFPLPDDMLGFEVKGDSMLPRYDAGDVVICWREQRRPVEALYGEEAAVRTEDNRRFLKRIMRSPEPGTVNLESWNARTIESVRLAWVGEIYVTVRASQVRRLSRAA